MTSNHGRPPRVIDAKKDFLQGIAKDVLLQDICQRHWYIPPHMLVGLEEHGVPFQIKGRQYIALWNHLRDIPSSAPEDKHAFNRYVYAAYLLFGIPKKAEDFWQNTNARDRTGISLPDLLAMIRFPPPDRWKSVNFLAWGNAFIQHGLKRMGNRFITLSPVIDPVTDAQGRISLVQTEFRAAMLDYQTKLTSTRLERIFELSVKFEKGKDEFRRILEAASQPWDGIRARNRLALPDLYIDGKEFGMPGCVFRKLRRDDPRLFFLGDYTDCCERVTDTTSSLERAVVQASATETNAYYIVEEKETGKILAHSWAWRGKSGEMVFDGFESQERNFNLKNLNNLIDATIVEIKNPRYANQNCNGVFIGLCATHLKRIRNPCFGVDPTLVMPEHIKGIGMGQKRLKMVSLPHTDPSYAHIYISKKARLLRGFDI